MNNKSLKKNLFFNFIGQVFILVIPLITAPYLARIFREEGNGVIAFCTSIISYFTMFANLGFSIYGQREIAKCQDNIDVRSKIFFEIFLIKISLCIISFLLLMILLFFNVFNPKYTCILMIMSLQIIAIGFDVSFFYQGIENFKFVALQNVIVKIVILIFIFLFVKTINDIPLYVLLYSLSILCTNLVMIIPLKKYIKIANIKRINLHRHIIPSLIIFLPSLVVTIYGSLDQFMIGLLAKNADFENGLYSQALKLNQVMLILVVVIESVMISRNSYEFKTNNITGLKNNVYMASDYVIHLSLPMIAGLIILAKNLCSWFLGDGYENVNIILSIMSIRFLFSGLSSVIGNQLFIVIGKEKFTLCAHIGTLIGNFLLNLLFIPLYGAIGGAITTAIAEIIDFLILLILAKKYKYLSLKKLVILMIKPLIATLIMIVPVYFINKSLNYSFLSFILSVFVGTISYYFILILLKDKFIFFATNKIFGLFFRKKILEKYEKVKYITNEDNL